MDKTKTTKLTQDYLKECLTYDPETGIFTWNERPVHHFKSQGFCDHWNKRFANKDITGVSDQGYIRMEINNRPYKAHRFAFLYMEGYLPEHGVDHIDRNRLNNKWINLREVGKKCNGQNCNLSKANKSGVTGVRWDKRLNRWISQIGINYERKNLGYFKDLDEAVWARYNEEVNNPEWSCSVDSSALKYLKEKGLWEK
jgi:hypothetical protein